MTKYKLFASKLANFIGGFGYINIVAQWLWSGIPLAYPLVATQPFQNYFMPRSSSSSSASNSVSITLGPVIEWLLIIFAILFSIGIIIYAVVAVPKSFGRAGNVLTTKGAELIIPTITHNKKISPKHRRSLLSRVSWGIKVILVAIPILGLLIPIPDNFGLTQAEFMAAGIILSIWSTLLFVSQLIIAKSTKMRPEKIW